MSDNSSVTLNVGQEAIASTFSPNTSSSNATYIPLHRVHKSTQFKLVRPPASGHAVSWNQINSAAGKSYNYFINVIDHALLEDSSEIIRHELTDLKIEIVAAKNAKKDLDRIIRGFNSNFGAPGGGHIAGGGGNSGGGGSVTGGFDEPDDDPRRPDVFRSLTEALSAMMAHLEVMASRLASLAANAVVEAWRAFWHATGGEFAQTVAKLTVNAVLVLVFGIPMPGS